jgi:hypothetical protein
MLTRKRRRGAHPGWRVAMPAVVLVAVVAGATLAGAVTGSSGGGGAPQPVPALLTPLATPAHVGLPQERPQNPTSPPGAPNRLSRDQALALWPTVRDQLKDSLVWTDAPTLKGIEPITEAQFQAMYPTLTYWTSVDGDPTGKPVIWVVRGEWQAPCNRPPAGGDAGSCLSKPQTGLWVLTTGTGFVITEINYPAPGLPTTGDGHVPPVQEDMDVQ